MPVFVEQGERQGGHVIVGFLPGYMGAGSGGETARKAGGGDLVLAHILCRPRDG